MITYKDCGCGARKIHATVRMCEVCETWERAEQALDAQDKALTAKYNEQLARAEGLEAELRLAKALHDVAVKERDLARTQLAHAQADAEQAVHALQYELGQEKVASLDRQAMLKSERDAALAGVHAACGNKHGENEACVLESVRLVQERTAERDEARRLLDLANSGRVQLEGWRDALEAARARLEADRDSLLELAYIGEHRFPDLTWRARCEEAVRDLRAAREQIDKAQAAFDYGCGQDGPDGWRPGETAIDSLIRIREELLQRVEAAELGCDIAYKREPTQSEGDAHEWMGAKGTCFVTMGGWTGNRCRVCSKWVWGGPTACNACIAQEARDKFASVLADLFGWSDRSYLHAFMHVENAVNNMKASLLTAQRLLDEARDTLRGQHDPEDNLVMIRKIDAELSA